MKVALASDHGGFELKRLLVKELRKAGYEVADLGTGSAESVDYPDFAVKAARLLHAGKAERAIVLCGSGVGVCVAANKHPGVRAALCHDTYSARQAVEHDDANVLCLGARVIGPSLALDLAQTFLSARFTFEPRHVRRLRKLAAVEARWLKAAPRKARRG